MVTGRNTYKNYSNVKKAILFLLAVLYALTAGNINHHPSTDTLGTNKSLCKLQRVVGSNAICQQQLILQEGERHQSSSRQSYNIRFLIFKDLNESDRIIAVKQRAVKHTKAVRDFSTTTNNMVKAGPALVPDLIRPRLESIIMLT